MEKNKHVLLLLLILVFLVFIHSDSNAQNAECATDNIHSKRMQSDSMYARHFLQIQKQVNEIVNNQDHADLNGTVYTIPVVVHVIHLGEPVGTGTNIPDSVIYQAIDGLNQRFRHLTGNGVDTEIEFCLATRDTNGNPTTGINRVSGAGLPNYAAHGITMFYSNCDAPSEADVKDLSRWPVTDYYNIWVVNQICQNFGGFVGAAYYPNGDPYDGTTIKYNYMSGLNYTLAHELGHGFSLYHTFEGDGFNLNCPVDTDCAMNGDQVCDTPPHKQSDCNTTNPCTAAGTWANSLNNYMSYCGSRDRFTQGQKDRMRATVNVLPRLSLLSSQGCSPVGIEKIESGSPFLIFPNPAKDQFEINCSRGGENYIEIFNLVGENIYSTMCRKSIAVNCENFPPGIYFIKIQTETGIYTAKLIKE